MRGNARRGPGGLSDQSRRPAHGGRAGRRDAWLRGCRAYTSTGRDRLGHHAARSGSRSEPPTARRSGSSAATSRRSSRCSRSRAGRARARPSPPTCGPSRWSPPPVRFARRSISCGPRWSGPACRSDAILESDAETVGLRPEAIRSLDVARFEACTDDPTCSARGGRQAVRRRPRRGPRPRLLRRRTRAAGRPLRGCPGARRSPTTRRRGRGRRTARRRAADRPRPAARGGPRGAHRRPRLSGSRSQVVRQYRRLCDVLASRTGRGAAARDGRDLPGRAGADDRPVARAGRCHRAAREHEPRRRPLDRLSSPAAGPRGTARDGRAHRTVGPEWSGRTTPRAAGGSGVRSGGRGGVGLAPWSVHGTYAAQNYRVKSVPCEAVLERCAAAPLKTAIGFGWASGRGRPRARGQHRRSAGTRPARLP